MGPSAGATGASCPRRGRFPPEIFNGTEDASSSPICRKEPADSIVARFHRAPTEATGEYRGELEALSREGDLRIVPRARRRRSDEIKDTDTIR
jgi:hypothetical protein